MESSLAAELPPLGDRPRGQGQYPCTPHRALRAQDCTMESELAAELTPLGDRPRGSRKGQCPLTPDCAQSVRWKAAWSQTYRHSATGLMARGKDRRGFDFPLAFGLAKKHKLRQSIPPRKD